MILDQAFATSAGNISERALSRNTRAVGGDPLHPLQPEYWKAQLDGFKGAFVKANDDKYFDRYPSKKLKDLKPIVIKDFQDEVAKVEAEKEKEQFCVYRCMERSEAVNMAIDLVNFQAKQPCYVIMGQMTGHIGHLKQAREFCPQDQPSETKILVEFVLRPNAHKLLFSPDVMVLGTASRKTALIAEAAIRKKLGYFVVKKGGEGYANGYIGIKPEKKYYSLAMQANKIGEVRDNKTKQLFSALTQYVKAIKPGARADCEIAPTPTPTPPVA